MVAGDDGIRKDLKPTKRQRELETMAMEYLHQEGRNVGYHGNMRSVELKYTGMKYLSTVCIVEGVVMWSLILSQNETGICLRQWRKHWTTG